MSPPSASSPSSWQASGPQLSPQRSEPTLSHRPPPDSSKGAIRLDVLVTDDAGRPIGGLTREAFQILDNKTPRPVLSFQEVNGPTANAKTDPPVEVILLVDLANASFRRVAFERYQIESFLRQNNGHLAYPTSLMIFSDQGVEAQPLPSSDGNLLAKVLGQSETALHTLPLTRGYDAIDRTALSLKTLNVIATAEERKPGRKLLLWIGPGWPMLEGSGYDFSAKGRQNLFDVIVDTSRELREARITLYSIYPIEPGSGDLFRADHNRGYLKGVTSVKHAEPGDLSLPVLAVHSGGRALTSSSDLSTQIGLCIAEAQPYYTLRFDPPSAEHLDEYHDVEVKIAMPHAQARTITGYYAEPLPKPQ